MRAKRIQRRLAVVSFALLVGVAGGCRSTAPPGLGTGEVPGGSVDDTEEPNDGPILLDGRGNEPGYAIVKVFYATDRDDTGDEDPNLRYGVSRGDEIAYGTVDVSIPRDHRLGELERPSVLRFQFRENPARHVAVLRVDRFSADEFFGRVSAKAAARDSAEALVFVHGYNVSFAAAARRTAQMSYDLGFTGAPIFYSWPSRGSLRGYSADETTIKWSTPHIKQFLKDVALQTEAKTIHLIAHSMGNRGVTEALVELIDEGEEDVISKYKQIILTAPDIDAAIFKRDVLPKIVEASQVTLYASAKDRALLASKELHSFPRAGDAGESLVVYDGLDTIDATDVTTSFLGHSYFAEATSIMSDIFYLLRDRLPASRRQSVVQVEDDRGVHFKVK